VKCTEYNTMLRQNVF